MYLCGGSNPRMHCTKLPIIVLNQGWIALFLKALCLFSRRTSLTDRATATAVCLQGFREPGTTPSTKPLSTGLVFSLSLSHACVFGETWVGRSWQLIFHHFVWAPRLDFGSRGPNSTQLNVFLHSIGLWESDCKLAADCNACLPILSFTSPDGRCQDTPALLSQETPLLHDPGQFDDPIFFPGQIQVTLPPWRQAQH